MNVEDEVKLGLQLVILVQRNLIVSSTFAVRDNCCFLLDELLSSDNQIAEQLGSELELIGGSSKSNEQAKNELFSFIKVAGKGFLAQLVCLWCNLRKECDKS